MVRHLLRLILGTEIKPLFEAVLSFDRHKHYLEQTIRSESLSKLLYRVLHSFLLSI